MARMLRLGRANCEAESGSKRASTRASALQAQGVPSRLVIFPDENHWLLKRQNASYWHWEMQSWLARFIGGKPTLEKPQFENKDEGKDEKKDGAAKPAEATT